MIFLCKFWLVRCHLKFPFACSMHIVSIIIIFFVGPRLRFKHITIRHSLVMVWFFSSTSLPNEMEGICLFWENICYLSVKFFQWLWVFILRFPLTFSFSLASSCFFARFLSNHNTNRKKKKNVDKWKNIIARMMLVFDSRLLICYLKHACT